MRKHDIAQKTSKESFSKVFEPVTSKLDDVFHSDLNLKMPQRRKRPLKKGEVPNHGIDIEDEVEDMGLDDLFEEQPVLPESEKQLVPKPPTYEESLQDLLEGKKELYIDPQYFSQDPEELPPEYDDDEGVDYALAEEDETSETMDDLGVENYESVDAVINQPEMTPKKTKAYLNNIIKKAKFKSKQLIGYKSNITKKFKSGNI